MKKKLYIPLILLAICISGLLIELFGIIYGSITFGDLTNRFLLPCGDIYGFNSKIVPVTSAPCYLNYDIAFILFFATALIVLGIFFIRRVYRQ
jgi:hypothetical protein